MAHSELTREEVFDVLRSQRRRYALHYVRRENCTVDIGDVADYVAAWEYNTTPAALTRKQRKRVYVSLYQTHLLALVDVGVIGYDRATGKIHPTRRIRRFDPYLGVVTKPTLPWAHSYLGLSVGSLVFLGSVWLEISPLASVSWFMAILGIVTVFAIVAISQYYATRNIVPKTPLELHKRRL